MRRLVGVVAALAVVLVSSQPAQAWFKHKYYSYYPAPYYPAPVAQPALSGLQIVQGAHLLVQGVHLLVGSGQQGGGGQQRPPAPAPVPADVRATISRVDTALNQLITDTDTLSALNPKYKDKIKLPTPTGGSGSSGGPGRDTSGGP